MKEMPDQITTVAEFRQYLSAVRAQAGRKGGKAKAKTPKGFATKSREYLVALAERSNEVGRQNRARRKSTNPQDS